MVNSPWMIHRYNDCIADGRVAGIARFGGQGEIGQAKMKNHPLQQQHILFLRTSFAYRRLGKPPGKCGKNEHDTK